ncbi:MAG: hypothetical protein U0401_12340 [Anaerolineae bacterium]
MQRKNLLKPTWLILLALILVVILVAPAAAQEPEGDVSTQAVSFEAFLWNPTNTTVSRGDGMVVTKLDIQGAEHISGLKLVIGYDASIVSPQEVRPGDLLPGTRGTDYFMTVQPGGAGVTCAAQPAAAAVASDGITDSSFIVNIVYFDPTVTIDGSGSLLDIVWRSDPDAAVGDVADICLDGDTSLVSDNGGFPGPPVLDTLGTITVQPLNIFKFQIGLEGGKNSGLNVAASPKNIFTDVKINSLYPCDGGEVDIFGFCAFNNSAVNPPYTVEVSRIGYLKAKTSFTDPHQSSSVFLLAGDLNEDNTVNILDIVLMASVLNQPAGGSTLSQAADFTGPPGGVLPPVVGAAPAPDGVINILDLVLVAKNFNAKGPTNGLPPGGTFPF